MKDSTEIDSKDLDFFTYPFAEKEVSIVDVLTLNSSETFGFNLANDELYNRVYVKDIQAKLCASKIFPTEKSSKRNLRGAYITHINGDRVFTVEEATEKLLKLFQQSKDHNHGGDLGDTTNSSHSTSASKNHFFLSDYLCTRKKAHR